MIHVQCPHCAHAFDAPDAYLNRTVKCPKCQDKCPVVPSPAPASVPLPPAPSPLPPTPSRPPQLPRRQSGFIASLLLGGQLCGFVFTVLLLLVGVPPLLGGVVWFFFYFLCFVYTAIDNKGRGAEAAGWCLLVALFPTMGFVGYLLGR